jgi:hypothetical protein
MLVAQCVLNMLLARPGGKPKRKSAALRLALGVCHALHQYGISKPTNLPACCYVILNSSSAPAEQAHELLGAFHQQGRKQCVAACAQRKWTHVRCSQHINGFCLSLLFQETLFLQR